MSRKASGFKAWVVQRASAIYLAGYFVYLAVYFAVCAPVSYGEFAAWLGGPVVGVTMALFVAGLLLHAWIGLRDVVIDYVRPLWVRLTVLALIAALLWLSAASFAFSLLRVAAAG